MASPLRVAIVTSDGYETSGLTLDAVTAATDYMLVDSFSRFLEHRVVTENMELLRRMMAEYFCHCETTIREFIAQSSMQISIGPLEAAPSDLAMAQQLLHARQPFVATGRCALVFTFLASKLRTVRVSLLMQFFEEFCRGDDTALRTFIAESSGFVSIFPVAASTVFVAPDGIPFESIESRSMPPPPSFGAKTSRGEILLKPPQQIQPKGTKRKAKGILTPRAHLRGSSDDEEKASTFEINSDEDEYHDDVDQSSPLAVTANRNRPDEATIQIKAKLVDFIRQVEKNAPWIMVFSDTLPLPFDETMHPKLAHEFRSFWARYGHAVWERRFWCPLSSNEDRLDKSRRQTRQRNAAVAFEKLIQQCFELFGPKFFYKLDRKRHPGWWDRGVCVDLFGLCMIVGYDKCIEYVTTQQHERFPDCGQLLPLKSRNMWVIQRRQESVVSKSLWAIGFRQGTSALERKYLQYLTKRKEKKHAKKAGMNKESTNPAW